MRYADRERHELPFEWPTTPFEIVLVEPVIPPNTGNIARLCAATATPLHLVEPLGFDLSEKQLRRAGLDYWDAVNLTVHTSFDRYLEVTPTHNDISSPPPQNKIMRRLPIDPVRT